MSGTAASAHEDLAWERLDSAGIDWRHYYVGIPRPSLLGRMEWESRLFALAHFFDDAANGVLPRFSVVHPGPVLGNSLDRDVSQLVVSSLLTALEASSHEATLLVLDETGLGPVCRDQAGAPVRARTGSTLIDSDAPVGLLNLSQIAAQWAMGVVSDSGGTMATNFLDLAPMLRERSTRFAHPMLFPEHAIQDYCNRSGPHLFPEHELARVRDVAPWLDGSAVISEVAMGVFRRAEAQGLLVTG